MYARHALLQWSSKAGRRGSFGQLTILPALFRPGGVASDDQGGPGGLRGTQIIAYLEPVLNLQLWPHFPGIARH